MGPIRRCKSRKNAEQPTASTTLFTPPLSQPQPSDWWHDFSKKFHGRFAKSTDSQSFESMFKMSMKTFDYISSLVKEEMMTNTSSFSDLNGTPLNIYDVVAIALRRLGSGESLSVVGSSLNVNQTTVAQITKRFTQALEVRGLCHLRWPSTEAEMEEVKSRLEKISGLPNCCGAIDTTHILMCLSNADRSTKVWCDRENNQTMTLQAIVDADMRFLDIVAGWPGKMTDDRIHTESTCFQLAKEGKRFDGKSRELSEGKEIEEYIVGTSGFALLPWLLTPYQGNELRDYEVKFNEKLFETQMVAQKAFTKLKQNWKIIQGVMWRPDKDRLPMIILACCMLHNILIDMEDEVQQQLEFPHQHDLDYRPAVCRSADDPNGSVLREKLALHLSGRSTP